MQAFLKSGKLGSSSEPKLTKPQLKEKKAACTPWVEKYRPRNVDDVAYQDEVVAVLKKSLQGADLPNLLFYGPPGTGKTSTILAAARQLFGDLYKQRVLELNASDERGIKVVRDKVKGFAQSTTSNIRPDGKPCPPFKIIILDEADSMTRDAQAALRRIMEVQSGSTRFCLICNYVSRIIEPLTSRCSKFRFKPLAQDILTQRLMYICKEENVECKEGALEAIVETSEGDLRRAITTLQSAARLVGGKNITKEDIYEITGVVATKWLVELMEICAASSYEKLQEFLTRYMAEGYSAGQLITQLHDWINSDHHHLSDSQKAAIFEKLGECDYRLVEGGDEYLQVLDLCCIITKQVCNAK